MSYADATAFAASLATTLMVSIVVFQAGDGTGRGNIGRSLAPVAR